MFSERAWCWNITCSGFLLHIGGTELGMTYLGVVLVGTCFWYCLTLHCNEHIVNTLKLASITTKCIIMDTCYTESLLNVKKLCWNLFVATGMRSTYLHYNPPLFDGGTILMFEVKFNPFNAIFNHQMYCFPASLVLKLLIQVLTPFLWEKVIHYLEAKCITADVLPSQGNRSSGISVKKNAN